MNNIVVGYNYTTANTSPSNVDLGMLHVDETASIAYDGTLLPAGTAKYGSERVVNGGFDTDTSWTKESNWTISGGKANVANVGVATYLVPNPTLPSVVGKTYLITLTVSNYVAGTVRFTCGGVNGQAITVNGDYTEIITATTTSTFALYAGTTANCSFDNVSVKEVLINPTKRYLKDLGKDKNHVLVESGQGKFFNGSNQYINTGIIPNQAQGTLVTRFTWGGSNARCIAGFKNSSDNGMWLGMTSGLLGISFGSIVYSSSGLSDFALVSGSSYHVTVRYSGLNIELIVNGVLIKSMVSSTLLAGWLPIFVGARNNNGTQDLFHSSVIDETYYYDVALTDAQISTLYQYPEKIKAYNGAIVPDIGNEANCKLFLPMSESNNTLAHVYNVAVNPNTQLSIASFTASCVDSAKQLSYGAQCIAWKRDALGLPIGMSGGLSFDKILSVKAVNSGWVPTMSEDFVVSVIQEFANDGVAHGSGFATSTNPRLIVGESSGNHGLEIIGTQFTTGTTSGGTTFRQVTIEKVGNVYTLIVDGTQEGQTTQTIAQDVRTWWFGAVNGSSSFNIGKRLGTAKVWKGSQVAKYNRAKEWAKAQKIIAKLGA